MADVKMENEGQEEILIEESKFSLEPPYIPSTPSLNRTSSLIIPTSSDSTHATLWTIPTSSSEPPLHHPIPTKPRSNSQLHSTRPAPPSPVPSRATSQVPSPPISRDRAGSTSSSSRGVRNSHRRVSGTASRASSKARPRSTLGTSSRVATASAATSISTSSEGNSPTPILPETGLSTSLATTPIPEDSPTLGQSPPHPLVLIIRDYAYPIADERHRVIPVAPHSASTQTSIFDASNPDASGSGNKKGWSGFNLLSWRGFMGRSKRESADSSTSSRAADNEDDNGVEDDDYPLPVPDNDDDYAFSSASSDEEGDGDEPWGLYRAAFKFEAIGEHEIGLEEGDLVEVRGRGGGEGWVVAISRKSSSGEVGKLEVGESARKDQEGLVPESYLEKVQENGHDAGENQTTEPA